MDGDSISNDGGANQPSTPVGTISHTALREFATNVLFKHGVPRDQASDAANVLVDTSLRGVDTHGIRNLKRYYVDGLTEGRIKPAGEFRVEHETPVSARVNGDGGLGPAAACWAMRLALQKAAHAGIGFVSMNNSNHFGAAGHYALQAAQQGLAGLCMTGFLFADGNDSGVVPVFGARPMLSTNPLAVAFPTDAQPPFLLDMSTSIVPVNRIELNRDSGQPIPAGWALDKTAQPTVDPHAAEWLLPLGSSRDLGAHKGYGLSLVVEIFTALLSGAWTQRSAGERPIDAIIPEMAKPSASHQAVNHQAANHQAANEENADTPTGDHSASQASASAYHQTAISHFFGAFRIDLFGPLADFRSALDGMIDTLHSCPPAHTDQSVLVPGELEAKTEIDRRQNGIPLPAVIMQDLEDLSRMYEEPLVVANS